MVNRKSSEQIKEEILSCLNECPLSIEQIRLKVDSNWSTVNSHLDELARSGKVKELLSNDKAKIYQKILGDTYFDIPITEEERKKFKTLFSLILQEYKLQGKLPKRTCFAKCAVQVIKDESSGLSDLPTIWYLYGMIPQMIADPSLEYFEEVPLKNKQKIKEIIIEFIKNEPESTKKLNQNQHKKYGEELYIVADEIFTVLSKKEWNNSELIELLNKFFIACPIDFDFPEIFDLTEKVFSLIEKLDLLGEKLCEHRKEILLTFDSLWKFIALYKLYQSKIKCKNPMNKEHLLKFYLGNFIESRKTTLKENIAELNTTYLNNLSKFDANKIKLPDEVKEIRKIMEDWSGD